MPFAFSITLRTAFLLLCPTMQIELSSEDARASFSEAAARRGSVEGLGG